MNYDLWRHPCRCLRTVPQPHDTDFDRVPGLTRYAPV
jgi:hypothetical protein